MTSTLIPSANFMKYFNYLSYFLLLFNVLLVKAQSRKDSLLVFVGQKIEIKKFSPQVKKNTFLMDEAFLPSLELSPTRRASATNQPSPR